MLNKIAWKIHQLRSRLIAKALKPNHIIKTSEHKGIKLYQTKLGSHTYDILEAENAQLYTNNLNNITLMLDKGIEPLTSW